MGTVRENNKGGGGILGRGKRVWACTMTHVVGTCRGRGMGSKLNVRGYHKVRNVQLEEHNW